jgi:predicted RNA-binding protein YlxR (DUF448 family)
MAKARPGAKQAPQRTCIACRQKKPKWELVRVVRTPPGEVEVDLRGKKAGRGAYLCRRQECWEAGLVKKKLEHALKTELGPTQRAMLREYLRTTTAIDEAMESPKEPGREGAS